MDFSKFKTSDWLKVGGAVGFLIFGFFDWISVSAGGIDYGTGGNVFDFFWTGTLPWILVIATGIITVLLIAGTLKAAALPWPLIMLAATGLAALLLLIRLIFNPIEGSDAIESFGGSVDRAFGMYLSVISGLVAFGGAFIGFKESGGSMSDLTDMDKLKSSFGGAGGSTPPPPPPPAGMNPPPPPPPPAG